ncbi:Bug family tripartite tricarboxylate transporter substrate binding protein [Pigmentiphaga litoralis]|uniref:Tripartite-type tricarboxylate transporter receptor subunit TctC n=1 Tax=Pigmentiphaga litoralis TaxID=516702 RepID=A0A7Y9LPF2_9BURK|nr:tripartite tricarboxylate transporter substrate binding protein [Pigmentiphaga litoralis]NYE21982.1 tripartite-type tricarboxylate transporter receptor subunit TctC [Pigmentiphaga litoralis]NYE84403.1 tripartite-type tricarboxylate transporter receptor subunit TctC [Pigmentiphaga litoralis]
MNPLFTQRRRVLRAAAIGPLSRMATFVAPLSLTLATQPASAAETSAESAAGNAASTAGKPADKTSWPTRPVRVIVPFAPAGTVDMLARYVGNQMQKQTGQAFVIENRPGAGGNVGTEQAVQAPADGYTLLVSGLPTHIFNPFLYARLPFDPMRDLTHIAMLASAPNLLIVNPALDIKTVGELVERARAQPGKISFSSAGNGTSGHLAGELLRGQAGVAVQHVPYKGQSDAISAVVRGDVAFAFVTIPGTLALVNDGRLRAIAVTSKTRSKLVPDVPTVAQAGYPDFEVLAWYSMAAPARTTPQVIDTLAATMTRILGTDESRDWLAAQGLEPNVLTKDAFLAYMRAETAKWGPIIRASGAVAN